MTRTTTQPTTQTLEVPGATLTYDIRLRDEGTKPILLLIASPMGAAGFDTLSGFSPIARSSLTTRAAANAAS